MTTPPGERKGGACDGETFSSAVAMLPLSLAVRVASTGLGVNAAEAEKVAFDCPSETMTWEGTVTIALLLDSPTIVPRAGAGPLIVTLHRAVPGPAIVPGPQLREVTLSAAATEMVMVPPDVVVGIDFPAASVVEAPDSERGIDAVAEGAICILRSAKSPSEITVVLMPTTRQVMDPSAFAQESDLPAAVAAGPADARIEATLIAGKVRVHWKPTGCAPRIDKNETGTDTVAPGVPEAEPMLTATL